MCDTLVLHDSAAKPRLFGKNSDRHPEEPQILVHVDQREPSTVHLREGIEYFDKGYEFLLSKPSWMRGGEMGINEKGLAIGNEAVFSRFKADKNGVLGMDILRAGLAACATATEAVDFLTSFVEKYEQGGNGAYKGTLVYSNSFLVVDPEEAYIVESAGKRWAWRKAMIADAISNIYCIEDDYKRLDTQTRKEIAPVNERAACSDEADPGRKGIRNSWKYHVEDRKYLFATKGEQRRSSSLAGLMRLAAKEPSGVKSDHCVSEELLESFMAILRSHEGSPKAGPFLGRMKNICIHPGIFPKTATTASMVVEYCDDGAIVWHTHSAFPCVSLFKPILLRSNRFSSLWKPIPSESKAESEYAYWQTRHEWTKKPHILELAHKEAFRVSINEAQRSIIKIAHQAFDSLAQEKTSPDRVLSVYANEVAAIVGEWEDRWIG